MSSTIDADVLGSTREARASIDELVADLELSDREVTIQEVPARDARFGTPSRPIDPRVIEALGVERFWHHQAEAIDLIEDGTSVVVATGTGSGKSLCYQVPIAQRLVRSKRLPTALMLFPTKALAHDQMRSFAQADLPHLSVGAYDGDSTPEQKAWVRKAANVVFTNPDMLHSSILPNHGRWAKFFSKLEHVVIDELHVMRGVFGSHVAHVIRRLRRMCAHYGSDPTFILASATIGEPATLAERLCGLPVTSIDHNGSPQPRRILALVKPPELPGEPGTRLSTNSEVASITSTLLQQGRTGIVFCQSRKNTELLASDIASRLPSSLSASVRSYRAGYLPSERRTIEHELATGEIRLIVATSALELGIDVGELDTCVLNGFPGTFSSMRQRLGRAGRAGQESLGVMVAGEDQLDQWLLRNPSEALTRPPEQSVINPENPFILNPHLLCAAHEKPLTHDDDLYWGDSLHEGVRDLVRDDDLEIKPSGRGTPLAVVSPARYPSREVGLRSGSTKEVKITEADGSLIGTVDAARAPSAVHTGAIYLHRGKPYSVTKLDLAGHRAEVKPANGDVYTQPRSSSKIEIRSVDQRLADPAGFTRCVGEISVTTQVIGFQTRDVRSRKVLSNTPLDLPPAVLHTRAFWYVIGDDLLEIAGLNKDSIPGSLHAAEHAAIGMLPLFALCDRWDVGGLSTNWHPAEESATIFIYDAQPGGSGIAELGFERSSQILESTRESIARCQCEHGCPSCVQSPKCGNGNDPLDKVGAASLLHAMTRHHGLVDAVPGVGSDAIRIERTPEPAKL